MKLGASGVLALAAVGVATAAGLWVWRKGGPVAAAGAAVRGTVDSVSTAIGIPTTQQTTTDAGVARWLIDNFGQFEASQWAGAPAYLRAQLMEPGTGTPPHSASQAGREFLPRWAPYDESDRLLRRYPVTGSPDRLYGGYSPGLTVSEDMGFPL